jgi:DNA-binding response OmpR family regulator
MKKILIADDDNLLTDSLEIKFQDKFETTVTHEGSKVVDLVLKEDPCVLLLDIMLPNKNGIEILKELKEKKPEIIPSIVMMTSLEDNNFLAEALELGVKHYVHKGTSGPEHVAEIVNQIAGCK